MKDTERMESMPDFRYPASIIVLFWLIVLLAVWQIFGLAVVASIGKASLYILAGIAIVIFLLASSTTTKKDIEAVVFIQRR